MIRARGISKIILCYVVRHGSTDLSPKPEWQLPIPLNDLGHAQAKAAGEWIKQKIEEKNLPKWGVSSDLPRAIETLEECSQILSINTMRPVAGLRAIDRDEDFGKFEERNLKAFGAIFAARRESGKIPLVSCHRSNTAFLGKAFGGVKQPIDYREASLVIEGGILEVSTNHGVMPIYGAIDENPRANVYSADGTAVSGFVTAEDNHPPRQCGHCKWMDEDHCDNPVVTADDEVGIMYGRKRTAKGKWKVEKLDCCNHYQHIFKGGTTISSSGAKQREVSNSE